MNKRGLSHIDWVISFGVFVIFLLLLFIWFGPSLTTEYSEEYLGGIASKGFKDASYHEVFRYPVFSEPIIGATNVAFRFILPEAFIGQDIERFSMVDIAGNNIDKRGIDGSNYFVFRDDFFVPGVVNEYSLFYSEFFDVPAVSPGWAIGHETKSNTTLGVNERLYGFSERRFNDLVLLDYDDFKKELKYPKTRNVGVYVYDSVDFSTLLYNYNVSEPTENDNVYVVSWSDVLINEDGSIDQITVLVKTW
ncbi:hypothetical protein HN865_02770 [Candidatus Woesearchaeota archaeon]|jgi:hypothetical protein|nr:hypothetical protein [Candidatus Woesearchaeota archaeon]MBT7237759.1 hypothetical protein [Candidatus Woesearchaeota archaeon]